MLGVSAKIVHVVPEEFQSPKMGHALHNARHAYTAPQVAYPHKPGPLQAAFISLVHCIRTIWSGNIGDLGRIVSFNTNGGLHKDSTGGPEKAYDYISSYATGRQHLALRSS
jgi:hypothetical protein